MTEPDARDVATAERLLRPTAESLSEAWRLLVTEERQQVERLPDRPRPEDFYQPVAESFRGDAAPREDPVLDRLLALARPDETWLDLGAGGGRYALPLARRVARVYAVEPSAAMRAVLGDALQRGGVANVEVFAERWPGESAVPVADAGLISQVAYDIAEIGAFLDQLEAHSRRLCVGLLFRRSPTADFAPLWLPVHGVERVLLPGFAELLSLLFARGATPSLELLPLPSRVFPDVGALHRAARRPLWVLEGSEGDARLGRALREIAVEVEGGVRLGPPDRDLGIVTWQPPSRPG